MNSSHQDDTPVLITEAQPSYDDQQARRRRRYNTMMAMRFPCLIAGVLVASLTGMWWLGLIIIALSIPLPWMAVLIANDRPPRKSEHVNRFRRSARALDAREHNVVEGT